MAASLLRETALGQIVRYATKGRLLKYPEELPDFVIPECYTNESVLLVTRSRSVTSTPREPALEETEELEEEVPDGDLEKQESAFEDDDRRESNTLDLTRTKTREETLPYSKER